LRTLATGLPRPPFPLRIEASSEQLMLGGRPLQNLSAELHGDPSSFALDRLDLRAPGSTHVAFNGAPPASNFTGTLDIDSSEPDVLMGWLQGRSDVPQHSGKPLRLHGNIGMGADGVTIDGLRAEIEGGSVQGRFALSAAPLSADSRIEATLRADQLDLDAAASFARSIAGPSADWPDRATVSLDVARASAAGQELRPFVVRFNYSPKIIALEQLKLGQANGLTLEGSGSFDRSDATGSLALRARAPSLSAVGALIAPAAPTLSQRLDAMSTPAGPARLMLDLDVGKNGERADHADARANFELSAPQLQATATIGAKPQLAAIRSVDLDALSRSEVSLTTRLSTERSNPMLVLLGLDKVIAAGQGPARLEGSVTGKWRAPLQVAANITGAGLDANVQGTAEPWAEDLKAGVNLRVRNANLAPLFGLAAADTLAQNIDLSSRVSLAGNKVTFDDIDATTAGSRLRGHLALSLGDAKEMQGEVGLDALKLAPAFALAIGAAGRDPAEPLGPGLARGWRGRVAFQALRGELPGGGELRPVSGVIKSDGQAITFDTLKGGIGGGRASATIDARDGANGLALNANVELKDVDGSALHFRGLKMPAGSTSLQMALTSQGRSISALTGALSGNGTATLQGASIMGLDPRAFELAIRASDDGQPMSDAKLRQIVEPALASGALLVPSAQIPFTIRDGRLSISPTTLEGDGISAIISGGYDVPADQTDIRASLTSTAIGAGSAGPEIKLFAAGPSGALKRSVDVTALSSWLAVRAVDRETKRLDTIERSEPSPAEPEAAPPSTAALPLPAVPDIVPSDQPSSGRDPRRLQVRPELKPLRPPDAPVLAHPPPLSEQVVPLPAPIEVRPPPGPARTPTKPKPRPPLMLTPPAATTP
jgi:hypothetical protein